MNKKHKYAVEISEKFVRTFQQLLNRKHWLKSTWAVKALSWNVGSKSWGKSESRVKSTVDAVRERIYWNISAENYEGWRFQNFFKRKTIPESVELKGEKLIPIGAIRSEIRAYCQRKLCSCHGVCEENITWGRKDNIGAKNFAIGFHA